MSNILEQSLDDIIGQNKSSSSSNNRRGSSRNNNRRGASRSNRHHPYRSSNSRRDRRDDDGDLFESRSNKSSIPEQVKLLANNRPTLRIKNIHPELNGEDLSKLFSNIGHVDFVKFDDNNDTIAYICFEDNFERNNQLSIEKFNGKKAMGNTLVVENATSLFDRINPNTSRDRRRDLSPGRFGRRGERGGRGGRDIRPRDRGRERGSGKPTGRSRHVKKSAEELDKELNEYMADTNNDQTSIQETNESIATDQNMNVD